MMDIELRKSVAIALGCSVERYKDDLCCKRDDHIHEFLPPYDLDHHAAMDALEEFCGDTYGYMEHRFPGPPTLFEVFICNDDWEIISAGRDNSRALAICQAIEIAAQKSEKKEAGE